MNNLIINKSSEIDGGLSGYGVFGLGSDFGNPNNSPIWQGQNSYVRV